MNNDDFPLRGNKKGLIALITGATSGIGRATAHEFAKHGINLVLCGRRQQRLESIQNALGFLNLQSADTRPMLQFLSRGDFMLEQR